MTAPTAALPGHSLARSTPAGAGNALSPETQQSRDASVPSSPVRSFLTTHGTSAGVESPAPPAGFLIQTLDAAAEAEVAALILAGETSEDIAARLHVPFVLVAEVAFRRGLSPRATRRVLAPFGSNSPWSPEEEATLARLWAEGVTMVDIGLALGRSFWAVRSHVHALRVQGRGLPPRRQPRAKRREAV